MEKIIKEFNVYTITELKELFPEGYEHAIEKEQEVWSETTFYMDTDWFIASIKAIIEDTLHGSLTDYSISTYDRSYLRIDLEGYMNLDNSERNELIKNFVDRMEDEVKGACSFTGVYTDCFFFDGLLTYSEAVEPISYNNFHKAVKYASDFAVSRFQVDLEATYEDYNYHEQNLEANDCLFTEDGKPYYK